MIKDTLGDRMKGYEQVSRYMFTNKIPVIIRLDGKAFHTFTKDFKKPFDEKLINAMQETTKYLVENIQGCIMGYTQSDEITLVLLDTLSEKTESWFNNNLQKIVSVSSSMCTAYFNKILNHNKLAIFDSRAFQMPLEDVPSNLVWRSRDCYKNAISSVAQTLYSNKELQRKTTLERKVMIQDKYDFKDYELYGTLYYKKPVNETTEIDKLHKSLNYYELKYLIENMGYTFDGLDI